MQLMGSRLVLCIPVLAVMVLYLPVLGFGYVWDDQNLLLRSGKLRDWAAIWQSAWNPFLNYQAYFRPLPLLVLGLEQAASGSSAVVSHAVSLAIHAFNVFLIAALGHVLARASGSSSRSHLVGACVGLLYGLHPALIEVVAWISCRFELMLTSFCLLALLCDRLIHRVRLRAVLVGSCFLGAALSKEMAVGFALALPFWHLAFERASAPGVVAQWANFRERGHLHVYAAVASGGVIYLLLRAAALPQIYVSAAETLYGVGTLQHLWVVLKSLGAYAGLALLPFAAIAPLHTLRMPLPWSDAQILAGMAIAGTVLVLAWSIVNRPGWRPQALILAAAFSLLPVLNVLPLQIGDNYVHDRFLAMPLVFLSLWIVRLIADSSIPAVSGFVRNALIILLAGFWLGLSALNIRVTLPFWKNDVALWQFAYLRSPDSSMAQAGLMDAYVGAGMHEAGLRTAAAIAHRQGRLNDESLASVIAILNMHGYDVSAVLSDLRQRLQATKTIGAHRVSTENYFGWLFMESGDAASAEQAFHQALAIDPGYSLSSFGLGVLYRATGRAGEAVLKREQWMRSAHPQYALKWQREEDALVARYRQRIEARGEAGDRPRIEDLDLVATDPGRYLAP